MVVHLAIMNARKCFGAFEALRSVSLDIEKGEFLTFLGPSGSGKSTLLNAIAGFEPLTQGRILKDGGDIGPLPPDKRNFGMVFQGYALFPHLSVADNIAFSLKVRGVSRDERERRVNRMVDLVGLGGHAHKRPNALSGGQQQRCALARALVFEPELLLLDEPLSALDKNLREQLQDELVSIHQRTGTTFLFVTHDQGEALAMSDRIAIFNKGAIEQVGRPDDLYDWPNSRFVAEFLGTMNIIPLGPSASAGETCHAGFRLEADIETCSRSAATGASVLAIRPERLTLHRHRPEAAANVLPFRVDALVFQGSSVIVKGSAPDQLPLTLSVARVGFDEDLAVGQDRWVSWSRSDARLLES
ncbi:ABC transporter ATP-binding protein [Ensifer sp.]|uniref:ABC transporter ATP-binding protein n=1 Tax=Ensifer sp. TaxID=1872086 RepID=UPI0028973A82|nr:ABC transporter ATP-binding protein [Ensifer sp.]